MESTDALITGLAAAAIAGIAAFWWYRTHKKSPAEKERARRLAVNRAGRLTDGAIIDAPLFPEGLTEENLIFYTYYAAGVEYSTAQDISTLRHLASFERSRAGTVVAVKYDPRAPSNSIILCEDWSGLTDHRQDHSAA